MKAFIFDMDGVIINSETVWKKYEQEFLTDLLGDKVYKKLKGNLLGSTTQVIYELAYRNGLRMKKDLFMQRYDEQALLVYAESELTRDIDKLLQKIISLNFKMGLVTASRRLWIEQVLPKLRNRNVFQYVLSLAEREDLKPKPSPDGYLEVIKKLKSIPEKTIILEDSNKGIEAAKASGAFTICLREHLPSNYVSKKADMYIENLDSLIKFLEELKQ